ncbi:MAG: class I SAM-dependent methyltransferase [Pelodictyon phaeoclathratiforme]
MASYSGVFSLDQQIFPLLLFQNFLHQLHPMNNRSDAALNYVAFEEFFRGPLEKIKQRLSVYLSLVNLFSFEDHVSALDIGCGRGEWLELLRELRMPAIGIDSNHELVAFCRKKGLNVEACDLFNFLDNESTRQYGLITGFHLIEHIAPEKLTWFFSTLFDVMAPGGVLILETPNPENVTVGTCNFFIDPTHLRPVPPSLMLFLAVQAGFASPIIARLNRDTVGEPLKMMAEYLPGAAQYNRLVDIIASRLLQAPDYALIAFKPPAPGLAMLEAVAAINRINDSFVLQPAASEVADEVNERQLLERTLLLECELRHLQELLRQKEAAPNALKKTTPGEMRPIPFNEYPKTVRKNYNTLFQIRLKVKNKIV